MVRNGVYVRFERGRDDVTGPIFGPYPFIQVTYEELRVGPDGDTLAVMNAAGDWELTQLAKEYAGAYFSDFIISDSDA